VQFLHDYPHPFAVDISGYLEDAEKALGRAADYLGNGVNEWASSTLGWHQRASQLTENET
jgi:hypothetical protein